MSITSLPNELLAQLLEYAAIVSPASLVALASTSKLFHGVYKLREASFLETITRQSTSSEDIYQRTLARARAERTLNGEEVPGNDCGLATLRVAVQMRTGPGVIARCIQDNWRRANFINESIESFSTWLAAVRFIGAKLRVEDESYVLERQYHIGHPPSEGDSDDQQTRSAKAYVHNTIFCFAEEAIKQMERSLPSHSSSRQQSKAREEDIKKKVANRFKTATWNDLALFLGLSNHAQWDSFQVKYADLTGDDALTENNQALVRSKWHDLWRDEFEMVVDGWIRE